MSSRQSSQFQVKMGAKIEWASTIFFAKLEVWFRTRQQMPRQQDVSETTGLKIWADALWLR